MRSSRKGYTLRRPLGKKFTNKEESIKGMFLCTASAVLTVLKVAALRSEPVALLAILGIIFGIINIIRNYKAFKYQETAQPQCVAKVLSISEIKHN